MVTYHANNGVIFHGPVAAELAESEAPEAGSVLLVRYRGGRVEPPVRYDLALIERVELEEGDVFVDQRRRGGSGLVIESPGTADCVA